MLGKSLIKKSKVVDCLYNSITFTTTQQVHILCKMEINLVSSGTYPYH
jgi:hypothetical protein